MSLSYELAKELKDAGFPQRDMPMFDSEGFIHRTREEEENWIYEPTLSELIEACGEDFAGLLRVKGGWKVTSHFKVVEGIADNEEWFGDTPEIAVARLWLALNKK